MKSFTSFGSLKRSTFITIPLSEIPTDRGTDLTKSLVLLLVIRFKPHLILIDHPLLSVVEYLFCNAEINNLVTDLSRETLDSRLLSYKTVVSQSPMG